MLNHSGKQVGVRGIKKTARLTVLESIARPLSNR